MKTAALAITAFVVVGLIGSQDVKMERLQLESDMSNTCAYSYRVNSGPLEEACGQLIDQVQADGKHEVIADHGRFTVEQK